MIRQGDDCLWNGRNVNLAGFTLRGECVIRFVVDGNPHTEYVKPDELSELPTVAEIPAQADISPLVARAQAYFNRAMIRDERAAMLTKQHRYEDAENEETIHAAAAYDFLRAFKALEDAMPDVWERLKGDVK